jgi:pyruvate dehydrogenase E2 component (dihydrolipoamide acetyltransferase)
MTHGTISLWKAQPGDELKAGDVLCEIETDKASMGFELQDDSVVAKILVEAHGPELACGQPIALMVEDAEAYAAFLASDPASYQHLMGPSGDAPPVAPSAEPVSAEMAVSEASGPQRFSPAARHMAQSKALNTSAVTGTAKGGLISKSDLVLAVKSGVATVDAAKKATLAATLAHVAAAPAAAPAQVAAPAAPAAPAFVQATPATFVISKEPVNSRYVDIPASKMRLVIAKRLTESKAQVPHFYVSIECEIDELMALRKDFKSSFDTNISVNDLVIKSAALALRDVPEANAKWNKARGEVDHGNGIVDISVAVATPSGLITPIVTGADKRGLTDINATVRDLATRARDGKLKPEEYQGGSFSISNLGMFGISSFSAVINPPQACILAVGAGIRKIAPPKAAKGDEKQQPRVVTVMTVQLSGDRRVVDEAIAAQFLQVFRSYLSNPKSVML